MSFIHILKNATLYKTLNAPSERCETGTNNFRKVIVGFQDHISSKHKNCTDVLPVLFLYKVSAFILHLCVRHVNNRVNYLSNKQNINLVIYIHIWNSFTLLLFIKITNMSKLHLGKEFKLGGRGQFVTECT